MNKVLKEDKRKTILFFLLVILMMTTLLIIIPITLLLQKMLFGKKLRKMHQAKRFYFSLLSKHMIIQNLFIPILLLSFHLIIQIQPRRMIVLIIGTIMVVLIMKPILVPRLKPMHQRFMIVIMLGTIKAITRSIHICIWIRIRILTRLLKYGNCCTVWKKQQQQ